MRSSRSIHAIALACAASLGAQDPALNPLETIKYYEAVLAKNPDAREYVRLFMLPGVLHCSGGNGPDQVPWLPASRGP